MDGVRTGDDAERPQSVDLQRLLAGVRRRGHWVAWPTIVAMLATSVFVLSVSPRFTGVAKVLLEDQESYYTKPDKAQGLDPAATIDDEAVQSQAEAVATVDLARRAIGRLGLAMSPEFDPDRDGKVDQRVVDKFLSRLTVFPVPRSRVLQIEFVSRDPELAARGANTVAELFLQSHMEAKANAARAAGAWLSQRIEDLRAKVADADAKVEAYRAESGLLVGANGQTVSAQQLSDLNAQLANARSVEASASAKAGLLRKLEQEGQLDEAPASIADESMRRFVEQRVALKAQIAEAARTLLPLHPHMKELNAQLVGLDSQIRAAAAKSVRVFENDARLARDQVASLSAALAQQSKMVATGNADDVRLRALELEAKAARDQLESYLQKYREAAARDADNAAPADARIIATAEPPRVPTFPKVWPTILLATLSAFVVSAAAAAATTLVSDDAPSPRAVFPDGAPARAAPGTTGREVVADEAPAPSSEPPSLKPAGVSGSSIDSTKSGQRLADRLLQLKASSGSFVVLIVGDQSARALAIALETARRLSTRGPAVLVDLGASQDWFTDILDCEDMGAVQFSGLASLLAGEANFSQVIRRDLSSSLDVVAAGGSVSGDHLADALSAFVSAYTRVVLHASDWRSAPARSAAAIANVVVVVAPPNRVGRALEEASAALSQRRGEILAWAEPSDKTSLEEVA